MISYLISLGQTYFVVFISSTINIKDLKELEKKNRKILPRCCSDGFLANSVGSRNGIAKRAKLDTSKVSKVYDGKRLSLSSHMVVNSSKLCSSLKIPKFHISITVQDSSLSELLCVVVVDRCDGQTWPNLEKLNEPLVVALI